MYKENQEYCENVIAVSNRHLCKRPFLEQIKIVCEWHPKALILREKDLTEAVKAAEGMADDINGVMGDLAHDMQTALPTDFDVSGSFRSAVDGVVGKAASAFTIALNIATFNNYSSEDIRQLTNEVMETANQFAQRKGVVFA